jgi:predicted amidohydrolase
LQTVYIKNSLVVDSPEMKRIQATAAEQGIAVSLGFSERAGNTLFISQVTIDSAGQIVLHRRKMKATHMERTIFGDDACASSLKSVAPLSIARVGALSCWEHTLPLLKYNTHLQDEQIHVAAWPPLFSGANRDQLWSMSREGKLPEKNSVTRTDCCKRWSNHIFRVRN